MQRTLTAIGLVAAGAVAGCGEHVVLSDADGWLNLEYDCSSFESVVNSSAERSVVESYAKRIVYAASRKGDMDAIQGLAEAYDDPSPEPLERAVVRHVCSGGEIAAATVVDSARQANRIPGLSRGVQAPDFIAPWLDEAFLAGTPDHLGLADLRGRYVLVNFWATWCRPCLEKHHDLVELAEQYSEAGVAVLGILHRDRPARALEWLEENPPGAYRTVVDESGRIASLFGVRGIPRTFLIDPSGIIIENAFYIDPAKTTTLLEELGLSAAGVSVAPRDRREEDRRKTESRRLLAGLAIAVAVHVVAFSLVRWSSNGPEWSPDRDVVVLEANSWTGTPIDAFFGPPKIFRADGTISEEPSDRVLNAARLLGMPPTCTSREIPPGGPGSGQVRLTVNAVGRIDAVSLDQSTGDSCWDAVAVRVAGALW